MTPFTVRLPQNSINKDNNLLKIVCYPAQAASNLIKHRNVLAKKLYTGIVRDVFLLGTPFISVGDVKYTMKFSGNYSSCSLHSVVKINSIDPERATSSQAANDSTPQKPSGSTLITVEQILRNVQTGEIVTQSSPTRVEVEAERIISTDIYLNINQPQMWSPTNPNLYELTTKILKNGAEIESHRKMIGFTDIYIREKQIYLNGKPFEIKGICYTEDVFKNSTYLTSDQLEQDILAIKTLGANVIRFRQTIPNPYIIELCNKHGIMALIELPVYDVPAAILGSDEILVRMTNISDRIIESFSSCPSVLAFGCGEGLDESSAATQYFFEKLVAVFRTTGRPVYKIISLGTRKPVAEPFDFIGISEYRAENDFDKLALDLQKMRDLLSSKPLFVSFGFPIQPNNYDGYSDVLTLEFQAFYIQKLYDIIKRDAICDNFIYAYNDYMLGNPLLLANNRDQYECSWGIVDRDRNQRKAFQTLKALYNAENTPLVGAGSYSEYVPVAYIVVGLILCIVILFLANRYRRFREYLLRSLTRPYNFYADIRDQRIMSNTQTAILGLALSFTFGLFMASSLYFYRSSEIAQYLYMTLIPWTRFQEILFKSIWMPEVIMFMLTIVFFASIFIIAFILRIFSLFVRARIFFSDTFTITVWAATPVLVMLPLSIFLIKLLIVLPIFFWFFAGIFVLVTLWTLLRILKSTAVVFDIPPIRSYMVGGLLCALVLGSFLTLNQIQYSIFDYFMYFCKVILLS